MDTQLLIHEMAVPVSAERHGDWSLEATNDFGWCAIANLVPLMTVEFFNAASEYCIAFNRTHAGVMPCVILGLRHDENAYLTPTGGWRAAYVPAFVRRYPFMYSLSEDGESFALCVDESFSHFNTEGRGERLFSKDKRPAPSVDRMFRLLEQYRIEFQRTRAFCSKLAEFDLLEPLQLEANTNDNEKASIDGLMTVNRDKARSMAPNQVSDLARSDEFGLLHLHLQSMRHIPTASDHSGNKAVAYKNRTPVFHRDRFGASI